MSSPMGVPSDCFHDRNHATMLIDLLTIPIGKDLRIGTFVANRDQYCEIGMGSFARHSTDSGRDGFDRAAFDPVYWVRSHAD